MGISIGTGPGIDSVVSQPADAAATWDAAGAADAAETVVDELVARCSLSTWSGDPGNCRWCDAPGRLDSRWCSLACEDRYQSEHEWAHACSAALARDGEACDECGNGPATAAVARLLIRALIPLDPVASARLWRSQEWMALQLAFSVAVVHRTTPIQGYRSGCHHHLDGLVTICRSCEEGRRATTSRRAG